MTKTTLKGLIKFMRENGVTEYSGDWRGESVNLKLNPLVSFEEKEEEKTVYPDNTDPEDLIKEFENGLF